MHSRNICNSSKRYCDFVIATCKWIFYLHELTEATWFVTVINDSIQHSSCWKLLLLQCKFYHRILSPATVNLFRPSATTSLQTVFVWPLNNASSVNYLIIDFSKYQLNAQFFYSSTIYILHYAPQHVASSTLLIIRRTNCITTASGIVTLCK